MREAGGARRRCARGCRPGPARGRRWPARSRPPIWCGRIWARGGRRCCRAQINPRASVAYAIARTVSRAASGFRCIAPRMTLITDTEALAAFCAPAEERRVRRGRYRVHARAHLLADPVRGAGGGTGRGGRDRRAGSRSRSGAAARADGGSGGPQGVSRGAAGPRNLLSAVRQGAASGVRHPDRRDGVRLWRRRQLRDAGQAAGRRRARQGLALHRLGAAAADRAADPATRWPTSIHLRTVYERLQQILGKNGRAGWFAEEMAQSGRSGDLPHRPGGGMAALPAARPRRPAVSRRAARRSRHGARRRRSSATCRAAGS